MALVGVTSLLKLKEKQEDDLENETVMTRAKI